MADSIERISGEMDEAAEAYAGHHSSGTFRRLATRLRALSPAGGDWDEAIRKASTRAAIHSQYPITTDYDRGYAQARKDAASAIRELLAASPQQEPGTASDYAAWMQDPDSGVEPPEQWKEAYRLGREVGHEECAPAQHDPSGQTLAGAGGELRQALQNAIALWGHRCADCTQLVWLESAEKALATSAGTTGDDSEDAARLPSAQGWLDSHCSVASPDWMRGWDAAREALDAARRAREVGNGRS